MRSAGTLFLVVIAMVSAQIAVYSASAAEPLGERPAAVESLRAPLKQYCFRCHGAATEVRGKVNLVKAFVGSADGLSRDLKLLQKLIDALADGEMPPVLTMTSSPLRTKPISRGAWLVSTIFNDPPSPPPADVPAIEDEQLARDGITLREKLKQHTTNPQCAGCHRKIDPFGFALENYDPVGRWRETYAGGLPVDSSGTLFKKHAFTGPIGFKDAILAEKDRFARAFAGHLLSYALGRPLDPADRPSLDQIVGNSTNHNYRFRTLIKQVVLSPSFTRIRAIPETVKSRK